MTNLELINSCVSCTVALYEEVNIDDFGRVLGLRNQFDVIKIPGARLNNLVLDIHFNIIGLKTAGLDIFASGVEELNVEVWIKKCSEDENNRLACPLHKTVISLDKYYKYTGFPKFKDYKLVVNMTNGIDFEPLGTENILGEYVIFCKIRDNKDTESEDYVIKGATNLNIV